MCWRDQKGATIVEFAIILPILLLLLFGVIEFGLIMYNKAMITNASREGARRGVVYNVDTSTGTPSYAPLTDAEIEEEVNKYLSNHLISFGNNNATITISPPEPRQRGTLLSVNIVYPYQFLVFNVISGLLSAAGVALPGEINLEASTQMRME